MHFNQIHPLFLPSNFFHTPTTTMNSQLLVLFLKKNPWSLFSAVIDEQMLDILPEYRDPLGTASLKKTDSPSLLHSHKLQKAL